MIGKYVFNVIVICDSVTTTKGIYFSPMLYPMYKTE